MSYMGMNILEYIDWLMDQGMSEEDAEREASAAFGPLRGGGQRIMRDWRSLTPEERRAGTGQGPWRVRQKAAYERQPGRDAGPAQG